MGRDVYRHSARDGETRHRSPFREELVIPILALAIGGLLLVIGVWDGPASRPTEGGIGMVLLLFGGYALSEAIRSME